jgi:pimeloyl-ACP methyl ester carboxylesterase
MTVTDTPSSAPVIAEIGVGRPVLVLGAAEGSPGLAALATRFRVFAMADAGGAVDWIAAQCLEALGVVGIGAAAGAALDLVRQLGEAANALVLVSPTGEAALNESGRLATPVCVLIGDRDADAAPLAHWRRALHANTVLVFDAGADLMADRPDAFASAAGDFLDRQARFAFAESAALSR